MTNNFNRLIIVSNRLPIRLIKSRKNPQYEISSGGLVSSILSFLKKSDHQSAVSFSPANTFWLGSLTSSEYTTASQTELKTENFNLVPLEVQETEYNKYYNGFCNSTVWPLFHYFPSFAVYNNEDYDSFVTVNKSFLEAVKKIYKPGDLIWIHDYHLMLLPQMIREIFPDAAIGFFLHIPFPSFEIFRMLPAKWRREILSGLLGSDIIGFHTNDYLQYFTRSVREILGFDSQLRTVNIGHRAVLTDVFPVSIDYTKFSSAINDNSVFTERNNIKKVLNNNKVIISVDRLDYSKGIINRLEGFELFLSKNPDYIGKVNYMLVIVPSRDVISKYQKNKRGIEELVSRINGKYGFIGWSPVIYQYKNLTHTQLCGLYLAADSALITPVRDGMNLVAKEFVACRADKRGVLVLSETAGAATELSEAIVINPTDRTEIAESIKTSLNLSHEDQAERMENMQKRLRTYDVVRWAEDFISQLLQFRKMQDKMNVKLIYPKLEEGIIDSYRRASRRVLLLDYDGTLTAIKSYPQQAKPSTATIELLDTLSKNKKNSIVIISGRPAASLDQLFGSLEIDLVAEHGAFLKKGNSGWSELKDVNVGWKSSIMPIMNLFCDRCAGSFIEEKKASVAWHYRNAEHELGFTRSRELLNALRELNTSLDIQFVDGNKVIEVRPRGIDKGSAISSWLNYNDQDTFVLAAGDDATDEDLFRVVPFDGYTIRVGLQQSVARYNYPGYKNLLKLLESFVQADNDSQDAVSN